MESATNTWLKMTFIVLGRVIAALIMGSLWGTLLGVACGALCGTVFSVLTTGSVFSVYFGLMLGAPIGAVVGVASGLFASLLHILVHLPTGSNCVTFWRRIGSLMFSLNFLSALAGGLSGAIIGLVCSLMVGPTAHKIDPIFISRHLYATGWFYGSISGFFGSLLLAALFPEQLERGFTIWRGRRRQLKKTGHCELPVNKTQNIFKN